MQMLEFKQPVPVKTDLGDGMALYATSSGTFANDVWTVVLNTGKIRHFRTDQMRLEKNQTFDINPSGSECCNNNTNGLT